MLTKKIVNLITNIVFKLYEQAIKYIEHWLYVSSTFVYITLENPCYIKHVFGVHCSIYADDLRVQCPLICWIYYGLHLKYFCTLN